MAGILVEVCAGSAGDVYRAKRGGAHRVELNSSLFLGGLTPSMGQVLTARGAQLPIMAMVRPREGGFCYDDDEFHTMLADTEAFVRAGVEGIVFGILTPDGKVDVERCRRMMDAIGPAQAVFHRAIDIVPDWRGALDALMDLGVTRVLTSGQRARVLDGTKTVRQMREYSAGHLEILPGSGITAENAQQVLRLTGCNQIHVSMRGTKTDPSLPPGGEVAFCGKAVPPEGSYNATDPDKLAALMAQL